MSELNDIAIPLGAAILFGLMVALFSHIFGSNLQGRMEADGPIVGEVHRRARRKDASDSSSMAVALFFMPVFVALGRTLGLKSIRTTIAERYARAGWPGGFDDEEILAVSLMLGVAVVIPVVLLIALIQPLFAPAGIVVILAGPGLVSASLSSRGKQRELSITRTMPFVLDLLVLTMRAGASLPQALERVSLDHAGNPIGVEFRAILADLDMGVTTSEAFENLAERVPIDAVTLFVDDLVGAEELGRPLADTFERLADQARIRRVQDAMDTAGSARVMVLVPGMLVFLAALLLLFAPFIVRFWYGGYAVG